jgi:hypothetical protein
VPANADDQQLETVRQELEKRLAQLESRALALLRPGRV